MALFDQTIAVSTERVAEVVEIHWGAKLGKLIKASQNHTFEALRNDTEKLVVRVTPGATADILNRIKNEVVFINYVASSGKVHHVCAPVVSLCGEYVIQADELVIVVSQWAQGEAVDFMSYRWMTDRNIVIAWGRWLASFHAVSKQFSADHPATAHSIQRWDEMHKGILKGSSLHADDIAAMEDPQHYGVLHGDLNISNFFFIDTADTLSVFDWDQTQRGWYLWDVAQSELTAYMLAEAGSVVDGSPVPQANPAQFEAWMVEGYESVAGEGSVDRVRLARMVALRKHFYQKFCRTAKEQGDLPKDMEHFINYVNAWFEKVPL